MLKSIFPQKSLFSAEVCPTRKPIKREMSRVNNTTATQRLDKWPTRLTVYSSCCFAVGFAWQRPSLPLIWLAATRSLHVLPCSWFAVDATQINHAEGQRSETIPMPCVTQRTWKRGFNLGLLFSLFVDSGFIYSPKSLWSKNSITSLLPIQFSSPLR